MTEDTEVAPDVQAAANVGTAVALVSVLAIGLIIQPTPLSVQTALLAVGATAVSIGAALVTLKLVQRRGV